jgi:hypothetical protein
MLVREPLCLVEDEYIQHHTEALMLLLYLPDCCQASHRITNESTQTHSKRPRRRKSATNRFLPQTNLVNAVSGNVPTADSVDGTVVSLKCLWLGYQGSMKGEEEKQEETPEERHEETEYEDTLEDSNRLISPSSANDVEVNYDEGTCAVESGRQAEDGYGNEEAPGSKTHLPADAPWLSRMLEGIASCSAALCIGFCDCCEASLFCLG